MNIERGYGNVVIKGEGDFMRTTITISIDIKVKEELDKKIMKGKQSGFISDCVMRALKKIKNRGE